MHKIDSNAIAPVLRILARKGVCDVLSHIQSQGSMHYNEVNNYLLDKNIIKSRSAVTTILNALTKYELLERIVIEDKPPRTCYCVSNKGTEMIDYLKKIEKITKKK